MAWHGIALHYITLRYITDIPGLFKVALLSGTIFQLRIQSDLRLDLEKRAFEKDEASAVPLVI